MNGIFADISSNNGRIPYGGFWRYRNIGRHVLIGIKATEGTNYKNPLYEDSVRRAHKNRLSVIHYHFAHSSTGAITQARKFYDAVKLHMGSKDFYCLDIEIQEGQGFPTISIWCDQFVREFRRLSGHTVIGYSGAYFHSQLHTSINRWWIASYGKRPEGNPWAWQYTDSGYAPGIGRCDLSRLNDETFKRLVSR